MNPTILLLAAALPLQSTSKTDSYIQKIPEGLAEFKMVRVPDGTVRVAGKSLEIKNLYASECEITWDVYDVYAFFKDMSAEDAAKGVDKANRPSRPYGNYDRGFGHAGYPAIGMTYNGAEKFCEWLSKKSGKKYRLPTEIEWEYLSRANQTFYPGDSIEPFAWYVVNSEDSTHPVGKKSPNPWGFFDTLGNASEWCKGVDGNPITRGGSWKDSLDVVSLIGRVPYDAKWQERDAQLPKSKWWLSDGPFVGLRVVCDGG